MRKTFELEIANNINFHLGTLKTVGDLRGATVVTFTLLENMKIYVKLLCIGKLLHGIQTNLTTSVYTPIPEIEHPV